MKKIFERNDCRPPKDDGETYVNKFVIIDEEFFAPEYKSAEYQLFYATGGFGCTPGKLGNAVFGADIGENYRQERYNILGFASDEAIDEWEKEFGHKREDVIRRAKGL